MIALNVTDQQLEQLRYGRFHHPHPGAQRKIEVIFLRANGLSVGETCRIAGVSANTDRAYLRDFPAGGVDGLTRFAERPVQKLRWEFFVSVKRVNGSNQE